MLHFIQDTIGDIVGTRDITMNTDFIKDLSLNSLDVMNLIGAVEDRFNVVIPTREAWKLRQVKDLVAYLESKGITAL